MKEKMRKIPKRKWNLTILIQLNIPKISSKEAHSSFLKFEEFYHGIQEKSHIFIEAFKKREKEAGLGIESIEFKSEDSDSNNEDSKIEIPLKDKICGFLHRFFLLLFGFSFFFPFYCIFLLITSFFSSFIVAYVMTPLFTSMEENWSALIPEIINLFVTIPIVSFLFFFYCSSVLQIFKMFKSMIIDSLSGFGNVGKYFWARRKAAETLMGVWFQFFSLYCYIIISLLFSGVLFSVSFFVDGGAFVVGIILFWLIVFVLLSNLTTAIPGFFRLLAFTPCKEPNLKLYKILMKPLIEYKKQLLNRDVRTQTIDWFDELYGIYYISIGKFANHVAKSLYNTPCTLR